MRIMTDDLGGGLDPAAYRATAKCERPAGCGRRVFSLRSVNRVRASRWVVPPFYAARFLARAPANAPHLREQAKGRQREAGEQTAPGKASGHVSGNSAAGEASGHVSTSSLGDPRDMLGTCVHVPMGRRPPSRRAVPRPSRRPRQRMATCPEALPQEPSLTWSSNDVGSELIERRWSLRREGALVHQIGRKIPENALKGNVPRLGLKRGLE